MASVDRFDLAGKVALVTGGSRGIGRAMALGFADAGADVVVVSRKIEACRSVADKISDTTGRRALALSCNIGQWSAIDDLVNSAYEHFDAIDVLVNNAGMSPMYSSPGAVSELLYDKVFAVNLKGPFRLMALVGARMSEEKGGSIINISSHTAEYPDSSTIPYAAAKAGLNAMTAAYAHAFGPHVRVNCIQLGAFLTDVSKGWSPEVFKEGFARYSLQRAAEPDEVVGTALYLASTAASSYTTGAVIRVDGGNMSRA